MTNNQNYLSKQYFNKFVSEVFDVLSQSNSVLLSGVEGSGVQALLKYSVRNLNHDNHVFLFIDVLNLIENNKNTVSLLEESYREFQKDHNTYVALPLETKLFSVISLLSELTKTNGYSVTLTLLGGENINSTEKLDQLNARLRDIRSVRSDRISFLYSVLNEKSEYLPIIITKISAKKVIFPFFDKDSVKEYIRHISNIKNIVIPDEVIENIIKYSGGYGRLIKKMVMAYVSNKNERFSSDVYERYSDIFLDNIFDTIIASLSSESLSFLIGDVPSPTDFLLRTRILDNDILFSQLFEEYLIQKKDNIKKRITSLKGLNNHAATLFTGKEYEIYTYLNKNNRIVSKLELGTRLWDESLGETFSYWTIDKLLSNIRKKLKNYKKLGKLVTIRNKGVKLEN